MMMKRMSENLCSEMFLILVLWNAGDGGGDNEANDEEDNGRQWRGQRRA
jgi:hypothetical protein